MNLWEEILARVETKVNRHSFYTWFRPTTFVAEDRVAVTVRVPNALFKDWLTKHYAGVITEAMSELKRPSLQVNFVSDTVWTILDRFSSSSRKRRRSRRPNRPFPSGPGQRDSIRVTPSTRSSSDPRTSLRTRPVARWPKRRHDRTIRCSSTVGSGLGKTHLMHAIGQYVLRHDRNLKLTYISAERFMNEMINAVRYDRIIDFRERYRTVDVLLVDDVQFIAGKEGTQTEFFHTFNALYDSQKQIVISSDCPPHEIPSARRTAAIAVRVGIDRGHPVARSRDEGRDSQEKGRRRSCSAPRQRRDLHRRPDQIEHPRARRIVDSPDCVRVADRPGNHAAARPGSA